MSKKIYESISEKYRQHGGGNLSEPEVNTYLKARMPATFASIYRVMKEVAERIPFQIESMLDLGSGPGTGLCAAREAFPHLNKATCVERNEHMIREGKGIVDAEWVKADLSSYDPMPHDAVLFGYSFGELPLATQPQILKKAWEAAKVLVIVEPGTPRGFGHIRSARDLLIEWGGHVIAPCPHMNACPMSGGDWCHFAERLERTREHRQIKGGQLGWEDEKYSYVAFSKESVQPTAARILRHPQKQTGSVVLQLCTKEGLLEKTISKKQGSLYKEARKSKWGESLSSE